MNLISTGTDARDKLISGVDLVANKVKVSLGPSGKNVIIRTIGTTEPFTTKDGATIAKQIDHEDPFVKLAIECVQMVATQSEQQAGDGTTTASVLAQAMVNNWKEIKKSPKFNALEFKRGMSKMASALTHYIETIAIPVKDDLEKIREVAMVSSNHSEELADVVVNAFKNAGDSGVINVQRSKTGETYLKVVDGLVMPISYQHPAYINNKAKETCELNDCFVILTNKKITSVTDNFIEILQICSQAGKDVLIICDEIHDDITDILKASVIDKRIRACHVRALGYGKEQKDVLEDLAVMLDTTAFLDDNAYDWNDIELPELTEEDKEKIEARCAGTSGDEYQFKWLEEVARVKVKHLEKYLPTVKEVVINKTSTSIKVGEQSNEVKEQIRQRIEHLEAAIQERPDVQEYEINVLKQRKSRMSSGIAYINVHANSEMEYVENNIVLKIVYTV
jgi:chaperonin GroEL